MQLKRVPATLNTTETKIDGAEIIEWQTNTIKLRVYRCGRHWTNYQQVNRSNESKTQFAVAKNSSKH